MDNKRLALTILELVGGARKYHQSDALRDKIAICLERRKQT